MVIRWSNSGGRTDEWVNVGGAGGEYLGKIWGMTMWAIWGGGWYTLGFRVGGGALVAGVGKGVGKSGVVAMAVEGGGEENGGKFLNRSLFCPIDELCECP